MTKKQLIIAMAVVLGLVVGAAVLVLSLLSSPPEENDVVGTEDLSGDQIASVETLSTGFLQEAGTFGINMDTLTEDTVSQRLQDIANDNGGTSWTKRSEVAARVANSSMDLSGDFNLSLDGIANADYVDGTNVASFLSGPMEVKVDPVGSYIYTNRDEPLFIAQVEFSGTSTLSHFTPSGSGISSDPDVIEDHEAAFTPWDVVEQTVEVRGTLMVSLGEDGEGWRVRSLKFSEGEFALPFWSPPENTTSYPGIELGGTVVRTVEFPNTKETTDEQE